MYRLPPPVGIRGSPPWVFGGYRVSLARCPAGCCDGMVSQDHAGIVAPCHPTPHEFFRGGSCCFGSPWGSGSPGALSVPVPRVVTSLGIGPNRGPPCTGPGLPMRFGLPGVPSHVDITTSTLRGIEDTPPGAPSVRSPWYGFPRVDLTQVNGDLILHLPAHVLRTNMS